MAYYHFVIMVGGGLEAIWLLALHNRGVIHADFKPRNIVRSHADALHADWKLIDFDASVMIGEAVGTSRAACGQVRTSRPPPARTSRSKARGVRANCSSG